MHNEFLAMLPHTKLDAEPIVRSHDTIVVPEDMVLERAVASALHTGQSVVMKAGEYQLRTPLVIRGKLNIRSDGGLVSILGTCVLAGGAGAGGHIKGISFVGQGDDSIRVESGTWSFHNCSMGCSYSARSSSALWVAGGKVSLFACVVGQATNGIAACGSAVVEAEMSKISGAHFGAGAADSASVNSTNTHEIICMLYVFVCFVICTRTCYVYTLEHMCSLTALCLSSLCHHAPSCVFVLLSCK
jgi:hypothetical protein